VAVIAAPVGDRLCAGPSAALVSALTASLAAVAAARTQVDFDAML